jgi:hypothetical protein
MNSSSFTHGATLGGTRINGGGNNNSGLGNSSLPGQIMRTNTISHQPQNSNNNYRIGGGNQGQNSGGVTGGLLANNIFMNDSAPNLF